MCEFCSKEDPYDMQGRGGNALGLAFWWGFTVLVVGGVLWAFI